MMKIEGLERLEGKGLKAKVKDTGGLFTTYHRFAKAIGYPDACNSDASDKIRDNMDATYDVLAKGRHEYSRYGYVYVLESGEGERFLIRESSIVLINNEVNLRDMNYDELSKHVTEAIVELKLKAYEEGYEQGKFDQRMETAFDKVVEITNNIGAKVVETSQEKRDRIVEQAKKDIKELREYINMANFIGEAYRVKSTQIINNENGLDAACNVEFIVNKKKRTVVALMRGVKSKTLYVRGIAKAHPNDCFNVHIGKVIALRRALGLEVPDEYLNAPQPTEVRVGDVVRTTSEQFPMWGKRQGETIRRPV